VKIPDPWLISIGNLLRPARHDVEKLDRRFRDLLVDLFVDMSDGDEHDACRRTDNTFSYR